MIENLWFDNNDAFPVNSNKTNCRILPAEKKSKRIVVNLGFNDDSAFFADPNKTIRSVLSAGKKINEL